MYPQMSAVKLGWGHFPFSIILLKEGQNLPFHFVLLCAQYDIILRIDKENVCFYYILGGLRSLETVLHEYPIVCRWPAGFSFGYKLWAEAVAFSEVTRAFHFLVRKTLISLT